LVKIRGVRNDGRERKREERGNMKDRKVRTKRGEERRFARR